MRQLPCPGSQLPGKLRHLPGKSRRFSCPMRQLSGRLSQLPEKIRPSGRLTCRMHSPAIRVRCGARSRHRRSAPEERGRAEYTATLARPTATRGRPVRQAEAAASTWLSPDVSRRCFRSRSSCGWRSHSRTTDHWHL
jgi:hypothetical protein